MLHLGLYKAAELTCSIVLRNALTERLTEQLSHSEAALSLCWSARPPPALTLHGDTVPLYPLNSLWDCFPLCLFTELNRIILSSHIIYYILLIAPFFQKRSEEVEQRHSVATADIKS